MVNCRALRHRCAVGCIQIEIITCIDLQWPRRYMRFRSKTGIREAAYAISYGINGQVCSFCLFILLAAPLVTACVLFTAVPVK